MVQKRKPVIGVLSQEISRIVIPEHINGESYIATAYIRHLEAAGAKVIPIHTHHKDAELRDLFKAINGILLPGGGSNLKDSRYIHNARLLHEMAIDANEEGDYFPIWGTCLGFEALLIMCGGLSVLGDADATNLPLPLITTNEAEDSRIFSSTPKSALQSFALKQVKYHFHKKCITEDSFCGSEALTAEYRVLAYDKDRENNTFVSVVEGRRYPFYGVQWHPEKVTHETVQNFDIPKSPEAFDLSNLMGTFFVGEASKNQHQFSSKEEEEKLLIENYTAVNTADCGRIGSAYVF